MIPVGDPYVLAVILDAEVNLPRSSDHFKILAASSWKYGVFSQVKIAIRFYSQKLLFRIVQSKIGVIMSLSLG